MEITSCCIQEVFFCIWSEQGKILVEDSSNDAQIAISPPMLTWLESTIVELLYSPVNKFFNTKVILELEPFDFLSSIRSWAGI